MEMITTEHSTGNKNKNKEMEEKLGQIYAGFLGFISGTVPYIASVEDSGPFWVILFKTIVISIVSTSTGLFVRHIYLKIERKIRSKK